MDKLCSKQTQHGPLHRAAWEDPPGCPGVQPGQQLLAASGSGRMLCSQPQGQGRGLMMRHQEGHRDQAGHPKPQAIPWFCCLPGIPLWLPLETKVIQISCELIASEWILAGAAQLGSLAGAELGPGGGGLHSTGTWFRSGPGRTFE